MRRVCEYLELIKMLLRCCLWGDYESFCRFDACAAKNDSNAFWCSLFIWYSIRYYSQSSLRIGRRRWRLLSVVFHYLFHDYFGFVVQVVALDAFGWLAAVEIEVVMQGDAAGESLTLMLPQLVCRALPPEVAVGLVWNCYLAAWFRLCVP